MTELIEVVTTLPSHEDAQRLASALVERRLAACVQISGPITSVYHWEGRIETSQEWYCTIKSREDLWTALEAAVGELHPYQVPELLARSIEHAPAAYRQWVLANTQPGEPAKEPG